MAPVFIIGHYRSGTTFLHYLMGKDERFGYCSTLQALLPHIFLTFGKLFSSIISGALPKNRPMDNLRMGESLPKEEEFAMAAFGAESVVSGYYFPKNLETIFHKCVLFEDSESEKRWKRDFDYFLRKLTLGNGEKQLLLKSPANTGRVAQILSLYPDAKFIHLYRNPYDVFLSYRHLFNKLLPMLAFHTVSDEKMEEIIFETYSKLYKKYFDEKKQIPKGNLAEMKYEDFAANPLPHLEKTYRALGLDHFEEARPGIEAELLSYSAYEKNKFSLDETQKKKIHLRWKFAFDTFGYNA